MSTSERLSGLPAVDRVLRTRGAEVAMTLFHRDYVTAAIRAVLGELRQKLRTGEGTHAPTADEVMALAQARLDATLPLHLRPVVNATGVVLHTNLGRALLADVAIDAVVTAAAAPSNLEYDLTRGDRGDRDDAVVEDLCALAGAEAATVVNNNAAAVWLCLNTLAEGREVIVSRGELVEIGGSFRIPDVMAKSQAILREVGTTNRTHAADYRAAISPRTALLLKVHTSNYRIVGFSGAVPLEELVAIGRDHGVPVMEDLGSGALIDLARYGLPSELVVAERVRLGADVVTFSGDKLLGGPQAGLIVGRRETIARIKANPLKRAVRCDKLTLAALAATLRLYRTAPDLRTALPTLRWLTRPAEEMVAVGTAAVALLRPTLGEEFVIELVDTVAEIGSGALPVETLPSKAISVRHPSVGASDIERRFRSADPPIIGRINAGRFLLDLRGIFHPEDLVPRRNGSPGNT